MVKIVLDFTYSLNLTHLWGTEVMIHCGSVLFNVLFELYSVLV